MGILYVSTSKSWYFNKAFLSTSITSNYQIYSWSLIGVVQGKNLAFDFLPWCKPINLRATQQFPSPHWCQHIRAKNITNMCLRGRGTHITCDTCFPGKGTHITREMSLPSRGTHITKDMCFPVRGTHITRNIRFPGRATQITRDICFPGKANKYH